MLANTIQYAGQGYIYRCPNCKKVDRCGNVANHSCRFCKISLEFTEKYKMDEELNSVIQEINYLETGTVFGHQLKC